MKKIIAFVLFTAFGTQSVFATNIDTRPSWETYDGAVKTYNQDKNIHSLTEAFAEIFDNLTKEDLEFISRELPSAGKLPELVQVGGKTKVPHAKVQIEIQSSGVATIGKHAFIYNDSASLESNLKTVRKLLEESTASKSSSLENFFFPNAYAGWGMAIGIALVVVGAVLLYKNSKKKKDEKNNKAAEKAQQKNEGSSKDNFKSAKSDYNKARDKAMSHCAGKIPEIENYPMGGEHWAIYDKSDDGATRAKKLQTTGAKRLESFKKACDSRAGTSPAQGH